jgi:hypothetical protein
MTDDLVHVFPVYGREHVFSVECWCCPVPDTECPDMLVHRESTAKDFN